MKMCCDASVLSEYSTESLSDIELDLVLQAVARQYGYDFRHYSNRVLQRRLCLLKSRSGVDHLSELIPLLLHDKNALQALLHCMSITVTTFFRDPHVYASIKRNIIPVLKTHPFISVWCAGCATGEEAVSWAILLHEAGLLERSRIYATDINANALSKAREGIYSDEQYQQACANYQSAGGEAHFSEYCQRNYRAIKIVDHLHRAITFARHNLAQDGVFSEVTVVSCRNVMIYFNPVLKQRCINLFSQSLIHQGFLCLGASESIELCAQQHSYTTLAQQQRIYQKYDTEPFQQPQADDAIALLPVAGGNQ